MTKLLVSVRSAEEAAEALEGGAHVIDVKEPRRGSLGAATADELVRVREQVGGRAPLSAALGELLDEPSATRLDALEGYSFAKIGLSRCTGVADWPQRWSDFLARLPAGVSGVAVAYADHVAAGAPRPTQIVETARRLALPVLLIDTYEKNGGTLFDHLSRDELQELIAAARSSSMLVALAGSLGAGMLTQAVAFLPDVVAVRGGVCRGGRSGSVDSWLVQTLVRDLARDAYAANLRRQVVAEAALDSI